MSKKIIKDFDTKTLVPIKCACTSLKMASRVVSRAFDSSLDSLDINSTQYSILVNVLRYEPISQMRLADHLDTERTTLYRALDILEKKGLIKSSNASEGVAKIIELTSKGEKTTREARDQWTLIQGHFVKKFGQERWSDFLMMADEVKSYFREYI